MSRIHFCKACANEKNGVKTRIAVEHTCGKHIENVPVNNQVCECESKGFAGLQINGRCGWCDKPRE